MNISELENKLKNMSIDKTSYSINSDFENEQYCLERIGGKWRCYYFERGLITNEIYFDSEREACEYFYYILSSDPTVKL